MRGTLTDCTSLDGQGPNLYRTLVRETRRTQSHAHGIEKQNPIYIYTSKIYAAACIAEPKFHDLFSESDEDDSSSPRKLPYMAMQEGPCIYSLPNLINLEGPCYGRHTTLIEKVGCFTISMHGEGHSSSAT